MQHDIAVQLSDPNITLTGKELHLLDLNKTYDSNR